MKDLKGKKVGIEEGFVSQLPLPAAAFGDFISKIPGPLGIGKLLLDSGEEIPGFIAELRAGGFGFQSETP